MNIEYTAHMHPGFEADHWWIKSRFRIIDRLFHNAPKAAPVSVLEVGCGTGVNLRYLRERHGGRISRLVGTDPHATPSFQDGIHIQQDLPEDTFDYILLMDVLEHTPEPLKMLAALKPRLKSGGHLLITVPAFHFLWSEFDVIARHYKRYAFDELSRELDTAGWAVDEQFFLFGLLFPVAVVQRFIVNRGWIDAHVFKRPSMISNTICYAVTRLEMKTLMHWNRWAGSSIVAIAHSR